MLSASNFDNSLDQRLLRLDGASVLAITKGTVLDGRGGRSLDTTVLIDGMRIKSVGPSATVQMPEGATVIEARGLTVMPGLIDAHIHFMGSELHDAQRSYWIPSAELKFVRAAHELYETLSAGITSARCLGHGPAEHTYALRQAVEEGLIRGPRIFTSGWALSQTRGHGDVEGMPYEWVEHDRPRSTFCDGPDECRIAVRRNFGEGADLIKIFTSENRTGSPNFTRAEIAAIVDEAHRRGKKVAAHAKTHDGVLAALDAGVDTIEHGPPAGLDDLAERIAHHGATLVPTLAAVHRVATEGADWGLSPAAIDRGQRELDGRLEFVCCALRAGARVATGSDTAARAGFGTLSVRELELLKGAGMSAMDAIVAATGHAADALGIGAEVGTVATGQLADLLIVDGDPSQDIAVLQDRRRIKRIIQAADPLIY